MSGKWFQNWFNSPYYHILYHQRNDAEAESFINNLCSYLKPASDTRVLDIACGRGRHAVYLNRKGYDVTGIDLSISSIKYAQRFENDKLHFFVHDMRYLFYIHYFDLAFNLFTSFGYFESERDHVSALKVFAKSLKKDGKLVMDYFNTEKILRNLTREEVKRIDGIDFHISKKVENGKIIKTIAFRDEDKDHVFSEEVQAFQLKDFERLFQLSGLEVVEKFGNYELNSFDESQSDRLIFVLKKSNA